MKTLMHSCFTVRDCMIQDGIVISLEENGLLLGTDVGDMAREVLVQCSTTHPPLLEKHIGVKGEAFDESECILYAASLEPTAVGFELAGAHGDSESCRTLLVLIDTQAGSFRSLKQNGRFRRAKCGSYIAIGHGTESSAENPRCEWQQVLFLLKEGDAIGVTFVGVEGGEWMLSNGSGELRLRKKPSKSMTSARAAADEAFACLTRASSSNGSAPTEAVE